MIFIESSTRFPFFHNFHYRWLISRNAAICILFICADILSHRKAVASRQRELGELLKRGEKMDLIHATVAGDIVDNKNVMLLLEDCDHSMIAVENMEVDGDGNFPFKTWKLLAFA